MTKICKFIPTLSYTKAFLNLVEVFSKDLSEVQTQNERLRVSWKRCEHASCFENLAKPPSTEKRKWVMFSIELFWGSIFKGEGVSYWNPRYEESLEINLMHSLSSWNQALLFFDLIARGERSLVVGVCWRSISVIFAANALPHFIKHRTYSCHNHYI